MALLTLCLPTTPAVASQDAALRPATVTATARQAPAGPPSACASAPGRLLVRFSHDATTGGRAASVAKVDGRRLKAFRMVPGLELITTSMPLEQVRKRLAARSDVAFVEPDCIIDIDQSPNDPGFGQQWGLDNTGQSGGTAGADIDAAAAWDVRTDASGVTVAIIDTGMDLDHPDLAANLWTNPGEVAGNGKDDDHNGYVDDVHGWDFVNDDALPEDDNGHGTHVAGTVGARGNNGVGVSGVAWSVKLMPLKAFNAAGSATTSAVIAALEYAVANGARLSNNSYTGPDFVRSEYDAFAAAGAAGHLAIAAAGNAGQNADEAPAYPASFPLEGLVSVAATDDDDELASFSNTGIYSVQVAAPGVSIRSTVLGGGYGLMSGTSMASPHVAGVAALLAAEHPDWTGTAIRDRILGTTRAVAGLAGAVWTAGVVDAAAALSNEETVLPPPLPPRVSATVVLRPESDTGASDSDSVTSSMTLVYDITFDRPVHGLTAGDFTLTATSAGCGIAAPIGSGASYSVVVGGCSPGLVALALRPATVTDDDDVAGPPMDAPAAIVRIDRSAPVVSAPTTSLRAGVALSGTALPIRVTWAGSDGGGAGIDRYEITRSTNGGSSWVTVAPSLATAAYDANVASSGTVRYRVRAVDRAGNVGAWAAGPAVAPRLVQQSRPAVHYGGAWTGATSPSFSGGSVRHARVGGRSVSYTFTGRSIGFVTTTAPTRGKVKVYVNGHLVTTLDLRAVTKYRVVAWQKTWSTSATRTVRLVVAGTTTRPRIDLDAFARLK